MSDNSPAYVSKALAKTFRHPGAAAHPNQALCREWTYTMPFQNSEDRNRWLPLYLVIDYSLRKQSAQG